RALVTTWAMRCSMRVTVHDACQPALASRVGYALYPAPTRQPGRLEVAEIATGGKNLQPVGGAERGPGRRRLHQRERRRRRDADGDFEDRETRLRVVDQYTGDDKGRGEQGVRH